MFNTVITIKLFFCVELFWFVIYMAKIKPWQQDFIAMQVLKWLPCITPDYKVTNLSINLVCLGGCLFVCLYPINVKTAEPIGPKPFLRSRVTPGRVYGWSNFQIFASIKIRCLKILKIHEIFFIKCLERRFLKYSEIQDEREKMEN